MKKVLKALLIFIGIVLAVAAIYVISVFASYKRIEDNQILEIRAGNASEEVLTVGETYSAMTYNIGFGAYLPDFSFFMDGGTESRAKSAESVKYSTEGVISVLKEYNPTFALLQEVDWDSTRSRHVNQQKMIEEAFPEADASYAVNYASAYLFYPVTEPHGKSNSGMLLLSDGKLQSSLRRSFPISTSLSKITDLDRCYSVSEVKTDNGNSLYIYLVHMSAYTSDPSILEGQISMLCNDMAEKRAAGNYVICGGDFNHDLKQFDMDGEYAHTWEYPFPRTSLPEGFMFGIDIYSEEEMAELHNTERDTDKPYDKETSHTATLDGIIVSDNVEIKTYIPVDLQFAYSDHDPVYMEFVLK